MITNKEIKLGKTPNDNYIDYNSFVEKNKSVGTVDDLLKDIKNKNMEAR